MRPCESRHISPTVSCVSWPLSLLWLFSLFSLLWLLWRQPACYRIVQRSLANQHVVRRLVHHGPRHAHRTAAMRESTYGAQANGLLQTHRLSVRKEPVTDGNTAIHDGRIQLHLPRAVGQPSIAHC